MRSIKVYVHLIVGSLIREDISTELNKIEAKEETSHWVLNSLGEFCEVSEDVCRWCFC